MAEAPAGPSDAAQAESVSKRQGKRRRKDARYHLSLSAALPRSDTMPPNFLSHALVLEDNFSLKEES